MTTTSTFLFDERGHVVAYPPSLEEDMHHIILSGQDGRCDRLVRLSMDLASVWPSTARQIWHLHDHEGGLSYLTTGHNDAADAETILKALWLEHDGYDTVRPMRPMDKFYLRQCGFVRFPVAWPACVDPALP